MQGYILWPPRISPPYLIFFNTSCFLRTFLGVIRAYIIQENKIWIGFFTHIYLSSSLFPLPFFPFFLCSFFPFFLFFPLPSLLVIKILSCFWIFVKSFPPPPGPRGIAIIYIPGALKLQLSLESCVICEKLQLSLESCVIFKSYNYHLKFA